MCVGIFIKFNSEHLQFLIYCVLYAKLIINKTIGLKLDQIIKVQLVDILLLCMFWKKISTFTLIVKYIIFLSIVTIAVWR